MAAKSNGSVSETGIDQLLEEAKHRWLFPDEICEVIRNHHSHGITYQRLNRPDSGSTFFFNKTLVRYFRDDGHVWEKKKGGKGVNETHEKLKVDGVKMLNCYYTRGKENTGFQRRIYWMLHGNLTNIVLVHYLDSKNMDQNSRLRDSRQPYARVETTAAPPPPPISSSSVPSNSRGTNNIMSRYSHIPYVRVEATTAPLPPPICNSSVPPNSRGPNDFSIEVPHLPPISTSSVPANDGGTNDVSWENDCPISPVISLSWCIDDLYLPDCYDDQSANPVVCSSTLQMEPDDVDRTDLAQYDHIQDHHTQTTNIFGQVREDPHPSEGDVPNLELVTFTGEEADELNSLFPNDMATSCCQPCWEPSSVDFRVVASSGASEFSQRRQEGCSNASDTYMSWHGYTIFRSNQCTLDQIYTQFPNVLNQFSLEQGHTQAFMLDQLAKLIDELYTLQTGDISEAELAKYRKVVKDLTLVGLDLSFLSERLRGTTLLARAPETRATHVESARFHQYLLEARSQIDSELEALGRSQPETTPHAQAANGKVQAPIFSRTST